MQRPRNPLAQTHPCGKDQWWPRVCQLLLLLRVVLDSTICTEAILEAHTTWSVLLGLNCRPLEQISGIRHCKKSRIPVACIWAVSLFPIAKNGWHMDSFL